MKTVELELRTRARSELIARLRWEAGKVTLIDASPGVASDLKNLVSDGLVEWPDPTNEAPPRITLASDEAFLDRLGEYISRQTGSGLFVKLREQDEKPVLRCIYGGDSHRETALSIAFPATIGWKEVGPSAFEFSANPQRRADESTTVSSKIFWLAAHTTTTWRQMLARESRWSLSVSFRFGANATTVSTHRTVSLPVERLDA